MAVRLILVLVLASACALAGRMIARTGIMSADKLARMREDLTLIKEYTTIRLMPAADALLMTNTEIFVRMGEIMKKTGIMSPAEAFCEAYSQVDRDSAVYRILSVLFEAVGTLSVKAHEAEYAKCCEALLCEERKVRKEGEEKLKLYTSLGALLGLSVGIFLL